MTSASANSSATCISNSSPSDCHASANSSSVINTGVTSPPSVVNIGAPPPSTLLKEEDTKRWIWALLIALIFTFILLICIYLIVKKKKQLKECLKGSSGNEKYDVFLSFRGEDISDNFLSHLRAALEEKKVRAFIDENLAKGSQISPALFQTIEDSKISIVIFSQDYASSPWCLSELVKIVGCMKKKRQIVIPVFYRVDPSDVLNLTGSFGTAMKKHEESKDISKDMVQIWRDCLKKIGNHSGWDSNFTKPEAELIKEIANDTSKKLKQKTSSNKSAKVSDDIELGIYQALS